MLAVVVMAVSFGFGFLPSGSAGRFDDPAVPERLYCAGDTAAVTPIPSLTSSEAFDSGVLFESEVSARLIDHTRQLYAAARRIEGPRELAELPVLRPPRPAPV